MIRAIAALMIGMALIVFVGANLAQAAEPAKSQKGAAPTAAAPSPDAEKVNVENIKEKYWARGDETEMGVVQNRLYSKSGKIEVGLIGGAFLSDPFVSTTSLGGSLGYHINEYFSLHALGWKSYSKGSSALDTLATIGQTTNYNSPDSYWGVEGSGSFLYGKLSLIGKSIIYYDMHVSLGVGMTSMTSSPMKFAGNGYTVGQTVSQNDLTQHIGLGQRFYISKETSFRFDYRLMHYSETIFETQITANNGGVNSSRSNWTHAITIGFDFLFGGASK